jgi:hypothetical protein
LFEDYVFAWKAWISFLQLTVLSLQFVVLILQFLDLLFKSLLIRFFPVSTSDSRFSILKSLSSFFVFYGVFEISVCSIFINDSILQVLLLLIGQLLEVYVHCTLVHIKVCWLFEFHTARSRLLMIKFGLIFLRIVTIKEIWINKCIAKDKVFPHLELMK